MELKTLSDFCNNQYTEEQIQNFEEILLEELGWNLWIPTIWENLKNIENLLNEVREDKYFEFLANHEGLSQLSEIFKSAEFQAKLMIFTQVTVLG